jgi:hypothetical protein
MIRSDPPVLGLTSMVFQGNLGGPTGAKRTHQQGPGGQTGFYYINIGERDSVLFL